MIATVELRDLNAQDRCDACSAAAKVIATLVNGELMFCGHHARQYASKLTEQSVQVYDPDKELTKL